MTVRYAMRLLLLNRRGSAVIAARQAGDNEIGKNAANQSGNRVEKQRAKEGYTGTGSRKYRIEDKFANPGQDNEETKKAANECAEHHDSASFHRAHPECQEKRYWKREEQAEEVG